MLKPAAHRTARNAHTAKPAAIHAVIGLRVPIQRVNDLAPEPSPQQVTRPHDQVVLVGDARLT